MKSSTWSLHYYSPLGFVLVLIWSTLNIKLQKITANKFRDMTFLLRCLHFKPLNIYKHIPLFSLPKIKKEKENSDISGCTTKLGWKLFLLLVPWPLSVLCGGAVVVCSAGHGTQSWTLLWGVIQPQGDLMEDWFLSGTFTIQTKEPDPVFLEAEESVWLARLEAGFSAQWIIPHNKPGIC